MQLELSELDLRYAELRIRDVTRERRLIASLLEHGQQTPVLVVRDEAAHVLIDGYARVAALGKLSRDLVEAATMDVPEKEALVVCHRLDNGRERTALEEGWLLRELVDRHGVAQRELGRRLDRSTSWVSRRLALVNVLPDSVQSAVRAGKLSVQVATKCLVPLARANATQCEELVRNLGGEAVTVREMEQLYVAWKGADEEGRVRLCSEPKLFLRAEAAAQREEPRPEDDEQASILRDLNALVRVALQLCRQFAERAGGPGSERGRKKERAAWERARRAFAALRTHFDEEEGNDAGPRYPDRGLAPRKRRVRRPNDRQAPGHLPGSGPQSPA